MKMFLRIYGWLFLLVIFLAGCAPQGPGIYETEEKVKEAREHVETVERMKEEYYDDYLLAEQELAAAENNLEKKKIPQAYSSAVKSIETSKRILKQFYLNTVTTLVEKAKSEIEETTEKDPDNPLKDFLPELDAMLDYAEEIQENPAQVDLVRIVDYLGQATQITENVKANTTLTLDSDISFEKGQYELSEKGKKALQELIQKVIITKENYLRQFPDKTVTIKVTSIGYTDEVGFREGTTLVKTLIEGFDQLVPQDNNERRKFLNQRLSTFRAETIGEYFRQRILESEETNSQVYIEQDIVGKGEEIPTDVSPPYPRSDPRRRICKVYSYVIAR